MPLYSAIICGMSVMATRLPLTQATMPPTPIAAITRIRLNWDAPMNASVASVASSMPTPAQRTPLTAVTGELMRFRPRMNSAAATKYDSCVNVSVETEGMNYCSFFLPVLPLPAVTNIFSMRSVTT